MNTNVIRCLCVCLQTLGVDVRMIDSDDVSTALSRQQCQKAAEESAWAGDETDNLIGGEMLPSICLALVLPVVTHLCSVTHLYITPVIPMCHLAHLCHLLHMFCRSVSASFGNCYGILRDFETDAKATRAAGKKII